MTPDTFKSLADLLREPVLMLDRAGRIRAANQAFTRLVGAVEECDLREFIAESSAELDAQLSLWAGSRIPQSAALTILTTARGAIPYRCEGAALSDDHIAVRCFRQSVAAEIMVDAPERQQAMESLRRVNTMLEDRVGERTRQLSEANTKLREEKDFSDALINGSADGIIAYDRDLLCTTWNRAMAEITGIPAERVLGHALLEILPALRGTAVDIAMRAALEGRRTTFEHAVEFSPHRPPRLCEATHSPQFAPEGGIVGGIGFIRDISERHRIQEELRQAQKMEAVGQLTGGVAHDFNNLLTVIIGNLELIAARLPDEPRLKRLTESAQHAASRGSRLTQQLLTFSRRQELKPVTADVNGLLGQMLILCQKAVAGSIEVKLALHDGLWPCRIDPDHFEAAILNLVVNAGDAMKSAGVVTVETANLADVAPTTLATGDYILVSVTDTGAGMTAETAARAFEPFFTTKEVGKGTGLGLSQVYGFARQSEGGIEIDSQLGAGTSVRLYLPRTHLTDTAAELERAPAPSTASGKAILLVVEDDPNVRATTIELLANLGYDVHTAASGQEAFDRLIGGEDIDLLFSDIVMPGGMSGVELARAVHELKPELPILLCSGYRGNVDDSTNMTDEFPFIAKPYRPDLLHRMIDEVLHGAG